MVNEEINKRFRGHDTLKAKIPPRFHPNLERDYLRTVDAYTELTKQTLKKYMPVIKEAIKEQEKANEGYRADAEKKPLYMVINDTLEAMKADLTRRLKKFKLTEKLKKLANLMFGVVTQDWHDLVLATLGIDIYDDYYKGEFYQRIVPQWIDLNVGLIKTIPQDELDIMKEQILNTFYVGGTNKTLAAEIEKVYHTGKYRARFLARDQMAKLNGQINKEQQQDAGVTEYIWRTVGDERVRESHKKLNGRKFSWSNPPIVDDKTQRRCAPMEDYQCRCVPIPVFNKNVTLPVAGRKELNG